MRMNGMTSDERMENLSYLLDDDGSCHPLQGVQSIFLTSSSVEICGLTIVENEFQEISREVLLADIQFRGAISDFHPIKNKIVKADYDPLLIRGNAEDRYNDGNNFELAVSKEAADCWREVKKRREVARLAKEKEMKEKEEALTLPKFKRKRIIKPWISQGSELEMEDLAQQIPKHPVLSFQKKRKDFNKEFRLDEVQAEALWSPNHMECWPYEDEGICPSSRKLRSSGIQAIPPVHNRNVQSSGEDKFISSMQYQAQESPFDDNGLNPNDLLAFLKRMYPLLEQELTISSLVNIVQDDFELQEKTTEAYGGGGGGFFIEKKETSMNEIQSLVDLNFSKSRVVSHIEWCPLRKGFLAVSSLSPSSFEVRSVEHRKPKEYAVVEWDTSNPMKPENFLFSDAEVTVFKYHPFQVGFMAGGTYTGQIVLWDANNKMIRKKSISLDGHYFHQSSAAEFSHSAPITNLHWLSGFEYSKNGSFASLETENSCFVFVSTSSDGKILFWDTRLEKLVKRGKAVEMELRWMMRPLLSIPFFGAEGGDLPLERLCFPVDVLNGEIRVGSTDGDVAMGHLNRTHEDDNSEITESITKAHSGAIVAMQRSPFFRDIVVTVGGWNFKLWRDGCPQYIFISPNHTYHYTSASWSPSRPAVLALATDGGTLEIWDFLENSNEASLSCKICPHLVTTLAFSSHSEEVGKNRQIMALGDAQGTVHLMPIPRSFRRPLHEETKLMARVLHHQLVALDQKSNTVMSTSIKPLPIEQQSSIEELNELEDYEELEQEMRMHLGLEQEENIAQK